MNNKSQAETLIMTLVLIIFCIAFLLTFSIIKDAMKCGKGIKGCAIKSQVDVFGQGATIEIDNPYVEKSLIYPFGFLICCMGLSILIAVIKYKKINISQSFLFYHTPSENPHHIKYS